MSACILMNHLGLGMTAALVTLCVSRCTAETITAPDIRFAADGAVAGFYKTAGGPNLVDTAQPGRGFVVHTFTGAAIDAARLDRVEFHGDSLLATRDGQPPRLTFQVTRGGRYLALKLKRVEGLPAASLASLEFELNCAGTDVKGLSLDYMTRVQQQGGAIRVQFNYLWHRRAGDPLGGFAIYAAADDAEEDDALADIWSHEDLPHPLLSEPWTKQRVRRWIDDYYEQFKDMTTMILAAGNEAELYELTAIAEKRGIKMIYLHTDTWRGEYWPLEHSHIYVNRKVFPRGRADLARYSQHLAQHGMHLALHYVCAGMARRTPAGSQAMSIATSQRGAAASWPSQSTKARRKSVSTPLPAASFPSLPEWATTHPTPMRTSLSLGFCGLARRSCVWVSSPIWIGQSGSSATANAAMAPPWPPHTPPAQKPWACWRPMVRTSSRTSTLRSWGKWPGSMPSLPTRSAWGNSSTTATKSTASTPGDRSKFSDLVSRHLDHAVVSNTSNGSPVASNLEMRFSKIRKINQFGYHTVNLSFQLDDHRPATSMLDAWFELSSLIAKGVRRFQVLKPEPMFGVSTEILAKHGQSEELFAALRCGGKRCR